MNKLTACLFGLIAALALALVLIACDQGDKTVLLRYKFAPGLKLVYEQDMQRNVLVTQGDSVLEKNTYTIDFQIVQVVEKVNEDNTALIRETDSWSYVVPSSEDSLQLDTIQRERSLLILTQPDGDVLDVEFVGETEPSSQAYIKHFIEQAMPVFPPGEVSPGFSWTQTAKVLLPDRNMEASTTYEVVAFVREAGYDCAVLNVDGNLIIPVEPNPKDSVVRFGVDNIETTGKMYFAYREGMVVQQRERWVIEGEHYRVRGNDTTKLDVLIEADVDYVLERRTVVDE